MYILLTENFAEQNVYWRMLLLSAVVTNHLQLTQRCRSVVEASHRQFAVEFGDGRVLGPVTQYRLSSVRWTSPGRAPNPATAPPMNADGQSNYDRRANQPVSHPTSPISHAPLKRSPQRVHDKSKTASIDDAEEASYRFRYAEVRKTGINYFSIISPSSI